MTNHQPLPPADESGVISLVMLVISLPLLVIAWKFTGPSQGYLPNMGAVLFFPFMVGSNLMSLAGCFLGARAISRAQVPSSYWFGITLTVLNFLVPTLAWARFTGRI